MKIAFCLHHYFPHGGLQRDCLAIAQICLKRGHEVWFITQAWQGACAFNIVLLPSKKFTNHGRCQDFANQLTEHLSNHNYDVVVGFNKLPNLTVYFAADTCYASQVATRYKWLHHFLSRIKTYCYLETQVFKTTGTPIILTLSQTQMNDYHQYYHTDKSRFHLLPPGIETKPLLPEDYTNLRKEIREQWQINTEHWLLLFVGNAFKTKGLKRALTAIAHLPPTLRHKITFIIIGNGNPKPYKKLIDNWQLNEQVNFLGARDDVKNLMTAADLLIHPAEVEAAGKVLLEALVMGLPVLTTANCGYSFHINQAQAGQVLTSPFCQNTLNTALTNMLEDTYLNKCHGNALTYARETDLYSLPETAVNLIETAGHP